MDMVCDTLSLSSIEYAHWTLTQDRWHAQADTPSPPLGLFDIAATWGSVLDKPNIISDTIFGQHNMLEYFK